MASEDSVKHLVNRPTTLLALLVHRICDFHDGCQPCGPAVQATLKKIHRIFKERHVVTSRRKTHIPSHKRQQMRKDVLTRIDRESEYIRISWLRPDPAALKHLLSHLKELTSSPVLIHKKLRLDVEAQGMSRVFLYRNTPTTLALHNASYKPASRLEARQSFLLIVRTRHIFTIPPTSDGIRSAGYSDVPAYS